MRCMCWWIPGDVMHVSIDTGWWCMCWQIRGRGVMHSLLDVEWCRCLWTWDDACVQGQMRLLCGVLSEVSGGLRMKEKGEDVVSSRFVWEDGVLTRACLCAFIVSLDSIECCLWVAIASLDMMVWNCMLLNSAMSNVRAILSVSNHCLGAVAWYVRTGKHSEVWSSKWVNYISL